MASSITFVLKEPRSTEPSLIYLILRHNSYKLDNSGKNKVYQQLKFSTGMKWKPNDWNTKKHKGKDGKDNPDPNELNQRLSNMETVVSDIYRRLVNNGIEITADSIRAEIDKRPDVFPDLRRKSIKATASKEQPKTLIDFFEDYIHKTQYVYKKGQPYPINERTRQRYATTLRHVKGFAATRRHGLDFPDIDLEFYTDFVNYLRTKVLKKATKNDPTPKSTINMTDNTVGKHISTLKTILNAAKEAGINTNLKYTSSKFATLSEDIEKIYLTESELEKIYALDLSGTKSLDRVRDLFLVGCYTCLRFSDFINLKPENIYTNDKGTFLKIKTSKTGELVVLPIHWIVSAILKKYNYNLPRSISNQKMNDYLKEIGQKAKIEETVSITKFEGGLKTTKSLPKYKLIATHTARRSGSTNMYLAGIPAISIMKITGHKTEKAFMRYIQMSQEDNANKLIDHPFFKNSKNLSAV